MAQASARRSFHGPFVTGVAPARKARPKSVPLELVPPAPTDSVIGRALLKAAREEEPSSSERERVLAGVLAALRGLTGANG